MIGYVRYVGSQKILLKKHKMKKAKCKICGYVYDPVKGDPKSNIKPGTDFDVLPANWKCPICGASIDYFIKER